MGNIQSRTAKWPRRDPEGINAWDSTWFPWFQGWRKLTDNFWMRFLRFHSNLENLSSIFSWFGHHTKWGLLWEYCGLPLRRLNWLLLVVSSDAPRVGTMGVWDATRQTLEKQECQAGQLRFLSSLAKMGRDQSWLVVSTPLKNISQVGWSFPTYGKIKHVPNQQAESEILVRTKATWLEIHQNAGMSLWKPRGQKIIPFGEHNKSPKKASTRYHTWII